MYNALEYQKVKTHYSLMLQGAIEINSWIWVLSQRAFSKSIRCRNIRTSFNAFVTSIRCQIDVETSTLTSIRRRIDVKISMFFIWRRINVEKSVEKATSKFRLARWDSLSNICMKSQYYLQWGHKLQLFTFLAHCLTMPETFHSISIERKV